MMSKLMNPVPEFLTVTGVDARTNLSKLSDMAAQYPLEIGVLFSSTNKQAKYACPELVRELPDWFNPNQLSAHLCGHLARDAAKGEVPKPVAEGKFGRVQINGHFNLKERRSIAKLIRQFDVHVIFQHRDVDKFPDTGDFFSLFDLSGGRGEQAVAFPPRVPGRLVGYAGGIYKQTWWSRRKLIHGTGKFWIDAESKLRTDGWLDLNKVRDLCENLWESR